MSGVVSQNFSVKLHSATLNFEYYYNLLNTRPKFYFYVSKYLKNNLHWKEELKFMKPYKNLKFKI